MVARRREGGEVKDGDANLSAQFTGIPGRANFLRLIFEWKPRLSTLFSLPKDALSELQGRAVATNSEGTTTARLPRSLRMASGLKLDESHRSPRPLFHFEPNVDYGLGSRRARTARRNSLTTFVKPPDTPRVEMSTLLDNDDSRIQSFS